jgi:hypothetical protein
MTAMSLAAIPLCPLAGALVLGLGGPSLQRRFGKRVVGWIACATVAAAFVLLIGRTWWKRHDRRAASCA